MSVKRRLKVTRALFGALFGAMSCFSLASGATAAEPPDAARGLALAKKWCASCHLVQSGQKGPVTDAAPTFQSIVANPKATFARIRGILNNPHSKMPTNVLSRRDVDDLVEYFRKRRQP